MHVLVLSGILIGAGLVTGSVPAPADADPLRVVAVEFPQAAFQTTPLCFVDLPGLTPQPTLTPNAVPRAPYLMEVHTQSLLQEPQEVLLRVRVGDAYESSQAVLLGPMDRREVVVELSAATLPDLGEAWYETESWSSPACLFATAVTG